MSRYTVEITIRDNLLDDTVYIERNSDDQTWPWMVNTMFDALRGASFFLPENIDFPSISEMVEEWEYFEEEDARSDDDDVGYGGTD